MVKPRILKKKQKLIAKEQIKKYFSMAEKVFFTNKSLANRYITLARKVSMKVKTRIPIELKRRFCKHCYKYLIPNKNSSVRIRKGKVIITCYECKKFTRIPVKSKKIKTNKK